MHNGVLKKNKLQNRHQMLADCRILISGYNFSTTTNLMSDVNFPQRKKSTPAQHPNQLFETSPLDPWFRAFSGIVPVISSTSA